MLEARPQSRKNSEAISDVHIQRLPRDWLCWVRQMVHDKWQSKSYTVFFPFQLSCLVLLSAFSSSACKFGSNENFCSITPVHFLFVGVDYYAPWCFAFCLKGTTSAQAEKKKKKKIGNACQGSCCLKDTALGTLFWEKLVIRLVH